VSASMVASMLAVAARGRDCGGLGHGPCVGCCWNARIAIDNTFDFMDENVAFGT
jgi:hypothetical protein